jgi:hypothetical protein
MNELGPTWYTVTLGERGKLPAGLYTGHAARVTLRCSAIKCLQGPRCKLIRA